MSVKVEIRSFTEKYLVILFSELTVHHLRLLVLSKFDLFFNDFYYCC